MKLDYDFIKQILIAMENDNGHEIPLYRLLEQMNVLNDKHMINQELLEKFIGHIKILGDKYFIESSDNEGNYGFAKKMGGGYIIGKPNYRITAQGYEFLDILKNKTIFNKIKDFAISNAWEIGKQLLVQYATTQIK